MLTSDRPLTCKENGPSYSNSAIKKSNNTFRSWQVTLPVENNPQGTRPLPLYELTAGLIILYNRIQTSHHDQVVRMTSPPRCALCWDTGFIKDDEGKSCYSSPSKLLICPYCPRKATFEGDRFRFIKQIGEGAFSSVFLVEDQYWQQVEENTNSTRVRVRAQVLKVLHKGLENLAENETRWRRVVGLTARPLRIRGQAAILLGDPLLPLTKPLINMIFKEKQSLNWIRQLLVDVTMTLARLHKARPEPVLHADVKLDNILYDSRQGRFQLIDFGNCVPHSRWPIYWNSFELQSPSYRAPEVVVGWPEGMGVTTDCWSLGVATIQLLNGGKLPFSITKESMENLKELQNLDIKDSSVNFEEKKATEIETKVKVEEITLRMAWLQSMVEIVGPLPDSFRHGRYFPHGEGELNPLEPSIPLRSSFGSRSPGFWHRWRRNNLARLCNCSDLALMDLMAGVLDPDPTSRFTVDRILTHPAARIVINSQWLGSFLQKTSEWTIDNEFLQIVNSYNS